MLSIAQYLTGVLALAWVAGQVEWQRAATLLGELTLGVVAALVIVSAVALLTGLYMWYTLLNGLHPTRFGAAASAGLVVLFVNHLLPSRLSGRAVAPFVIKILTGINYSGAVAVTGVHSGLFALFYGLVAALGVALAFGQLPLALVSVLGVSTVLYAAAGVVMLLAGTNLRILDRLAGALVALGSWIPAVGDRIAALAGKLPAFTAAATTDFRTLVSDPAAVMPYAAGWVVVLLIAPGVRVWLVFEGLGTGFESVLLLPVYLVTAYSVTLLPLTPGGIGVTEASATAVFLALGVSEEVVVPAIFVDRFLGTYLPALLGWYPSLRVDFSALVSE